MRRVTARSCGELNERIIELLVLNLKRATISPNTLGDRADGDNSSTSLGVMNEWASARGAREDCGRPPTLAHRSFNVDSSKVASYSSQTTTTIALTQEPGGRLLSGYGV